MGADKFNFHPFILHLRRAKVFENRDVRPLPQLFAQRFRHGNSAADYHYIYIFRGTLQKDIAYITAHHVALQSEGIRRFGYFPENRFAEMLLQFLLSQFYHSNTITNVLSLQNYKNMRIIRTFAFTLNVNSLQTAH